MNKIFKIILSEPIPDTDDNKKALDQLESVEDVLRFKKSGKELAGLGN